MPIHTEIRNFRCGFEKNLQKIEDSNTTKRLLGKGTKWDFNQKDTPSKIEIWRT